MMPATVTRSPSPSSSRSPISCVLCAPAGRRRPEQRVVGHELTEHLLLEAEERPLVELLARRARTRRSRPHVRRRRRRARTVRRPRPCARRRSDRTPCPVLDQERPAPVPERVERTGEDQALEHPLREDRRVDLAAEVGERLERALGARAPRSPAARRRRPRCAPPTARSGSPDRRRSAGAKSCSDSFTSGGRTSMPIARHAFR